MCCRWTMTEMDRVRKLTNLPGHLWRDKWTALRELLSKMKKFHDWWPVAGLSSANKKPYRGTSLIGNTFLVGPYITIPRVPWWS